MAEKEIELKIIECDQSALQKQFVSFFCDQKTSDVTFYVGDCQGRNKDKPILKEELEKFPAHKFLLSASSPVFRAMFSGDWAEKQEVIVTDTHPNAFRALLRYVINQSRAVFDDNLSFLCLFQILVLWPARVG